MPDRKARRVMVDLLALAHERGCEAELADLSLRPTWMPADFRTSNGLRAQFAPDPACVPQVAVQLAPLGSYGCLIGAGQIGDAA